MDQSSTSVHQNLKEQQQLRSLWTSQDYVEIMFESSKSDVQQKQKQQHSPSTSVSSIFSNPDSSSFSSEISEISSSKNGVDYLDFNFIQGQMLDDFHDGHKCPEKAFAAVTRAQSQRSLQFEQETVTPVTKAAEELSASSPAAAVDYEEENGNAHTEFEGNDDGGGCGGMELQAIGRPTRLFSPVFFGKSSKLSEQQHHSRYILDAHVRPLQRTSFARDDHYPSFNNSSSWHLSKSYNVNSSICRLRRNNSRSERKNVAKRLLSGCSPQRFFPSPNTFFNSRVGLIRAPSRRSSASSSTSSSDDDDDDDAEAESIAAPAPAPAPAPALPSTIRATSPLRRWREPIIRAAAKLAKAPSELKHSNSLASRLANITRKQQIININSDNEISCRPLPKNISSSSSSSSRLPTFASLHSKKQHVPPPALDPLATEFHEAQLHCAVHRNQFSYTFSAEGSDEILVARTNSTASNLCSFYSWKHKMKKKNRATRWWHQQNEYEKPASELVAKMKKKVASSHVEFVLYSEEKNGGNVPMSRERKRSFSHNCSPTRGNEVWRQMETANPLPNSVSSAASPSSSELAAFVTNVGNAPFPEIVAILPVGEHTLPCDGIGGPLSLIDRWKSGGKCDCGSWDLGCIPTILHSSSSKQQELLVLKGGKQEMLQVVPLGNGLLSIKFKAPLSPLKAFASVVAALQGTAGAAARTAATISTFL